MDVFVRNPIYESKNALTYLYNSPFSGGPRICVGMPFANAEMTYILSRMFQAFTSLSTPQAELQYKMMILMVPSTEVHVSFERDVNKKVGILP